jgi:hypothetical protein
VDAVIPKPVRPLELVHRVLRMVQEPKGRAGSAGCSH